MNRLLILSIVLFAGCQWSSETSSTSSEADVQPKQDSATQETPANSNWITQQWNATVNSGSESLEQTSEWVQNLYENAKNQGLTTAGSVKEWISDDWQAHGDWEYQVIPVTRESLQPEQLTEQLNALGQERWECFHIVTEETQWLFFLKRSKRSILKNLPLQDAIRAIPFARGEE